MQSDQYLLLGMKRCSAGDFHGALAFCESALELEPRRAEALALAADAALGAGNLEKAATFLLRRLDVNRTDEEALYLLGVVESTLGRMEAAAARFIEVLALSPKHPDAMRMLADILHDTGDLEGAETFYRRLLNEHPGHTDILINLGALLLDMERLDEAEDMLQRAVTTAPDSAQAHNNLGAVFLAGEACAQALEHFRKAAVCDPAAQGPRINAGDALMGLKRYGEAAASFWQAVNLGATDPQVLLHLGDALAETGAVPEARSAYKRAGSSAAAWKKAASCPRIPSSTAEIDDFREELHGFLESAEDHPLDIESITRELGTTNFYASYHGLNNKELNKNFASGLLRACPQLHWTSPHIDTARPKNSGDHFKIAVVSQYFGGHTVANYFNGLLCDVASQGLKLHLFTPNTSTVDPALKDLAGGVHGLPLRLAEAREIVAESRPDVVLYPELGMSPLSFFMAFSRLAPRQISLYGHPDTSGIPGVDIALTPACMQSPEGHQHYSEEMITLPGPAASHPAPPTLEDRPRRGSLGKGRSYLCAQSLFKIHPDFDAMLLHLLQEDPKGEAFLFESPVPELTRRLDARLKRCLGKHRERVHWLKQVPFKNFLSILASAHVVLDTPHFNGGSTSFIALGLDIPVVTLPGDFMRGRQTSGLLSLAGCNSSVAETQDAYVETAVRLAVDQEFHDRAAESLAAGKHAFFDYQHVTDALRNILMSPDK